MYAGVVTLQGTAEQLEHGRRLFRERVLPILQAQEGFRGYYRLLDRGGGRRVGITLWESERAARASRELLAQPRKEVAQAQGRDAPPEIQIFEVVEQA